MPSIDTNMPDMSCFVQQCGTTLNYHMRERESISACMCIYIYIYSIYIYEYIYNIYIYHQIWGYQVVRQLHTWLCLKEKTIII